MNNEDAQLEQRDEFAEDESISMVGVKIVPLGILLLISGVIGFSLGWLYQQQSNQIIETNKNDVTVDQDAMPSNLQGEGLPGETGLRRIDAYLLAIDLDNRQIVLDPFEYGDPDPALSCQDGGGIECLPHPVNNVQQRLYFPLAAGFEMTDMRGFELSPSSFGGTDHLVYHPNLTETKEVPLDSYNGYRFEATINSQGKIIRLDQIFET